MLKDYASQRQNVRPKISHAYQIEYKPLVDAEWQQYEVEKFVSKSSSSIQAGSSSDPGVTPFDMSRNKLNTISFAEAGDRVDWKVNVEKAGFYNLAFKAMQSDKNSTYYRKLLVNGEVPFEEAKYIPFRYSDKWENVVVGDLEGNPYAIYLNAGENIISFEVIFIKFDSIPKLNFVIMDSNKILEFLELEGFFLVFQKGIN